MKKAAYANLVSIQSHSLDEGVASFRECSPLNPAFPLSKTINCRLLSNLYSHGRAHVSKTHPRARTIYWPRCRAYTLGKRRFALQDDCDRDRRQKRHSGWHSDQTQTPSYLDFIEGGLVDTRLAQLFPGLCPSITVLCGEQTYCRSWWRAWGITRQIYAAKLLFEIHGTEICTTRTGYIDLVESIVPDRDDVAILRHGGNACLVLALKSMF